ncbi:MAG: hypothetical protein AAGC57_06960 [Pseudomonadota bacterium]
MLLLAVTFAAFAALGWRRAALRKGNRADRIQFALAHAIPATLAMLVLQTIALRLGLFV